MKLTINQKDIPLKPLTKCEVVKTSPLTSLQQTGEYALGFETAITPELSQALGFSEQLNILSPLTETQAQVYDKSWLLFNGTIKAKFPSSNTASLSLVAPPGNIPTSLWNTKLTALDFGSDTIPTSLVYTQFYKLNIYDLVGTRPSDSSTYNLMELFARYNSIFRIFVDNVQVFAKTFDYSLNAPVSSQIRLTDMVEEFNSLPLAYSSTGVGAVLKEMTAYPENNFEYIDQDLILSLPDGNYSVKFQIDIKYSVNSYYNYTFNLTRMSYPSIGNYFDASLTSGWSKPYHLPMIYAPNFYGDKNTDFNGYVNLIDGTGFRYNSDVSPTSYTFCPSFKLQWIFETLCTIMGYTPDSSFWNDSVWKHTMLFTMVSIDKQLNTTAKPFNVYNNLIVYKDYLPDFTVLEFINHLSNWLNVMIYFNPITQTASIRTRGISLSAPSIILDSYAQISEKVATDTKTYSFKYSISETDDASLTNIKFATDTPTVTTDVQEIEVVFVPMVFQSEYIDVSTGNPKAIPPRATTSGNGSAWNWSGTVPVATGEVSGYMACYQQGKSAMYGLATEAPKCRVLFYTLSSGVQTLANVKDGKSLFISGNDGLYATLWQAYLKMFEGTIELSVNTNLPKLMLYQIDWGSTLLLQNMAWVASEIRIDPDSDIAKLKLWRVKPF